jgi:ribosomal protein S18 acetylase RimI-like enzyme
VKKVASRAQAGLDAAMTPRLITDPTEGAAVLSLLQAAFAGMDGRIDPPSSLHGMTPASLFATAGEVWAIGRPPVACVIMTPRAEELYLGKLAVAAAARGQGHCRALITQATLRARSLGLPKLALQTRVELTENQSIFRALGFVETGRSAHPGYLRPTTITFERPV